jgi:hypothetical protein
MPIVPLKRLAQLDDTPSHKQLYRHASKKPRPSWVCSRKKVLHVDTSHPDWLIYLGKYRSKASYNEPRKAKLKAIVAKKKETKKSVSEDTISSNDVEAEHIEPVQQRKKSTVAKKLGDIKLGLENRKLETIVKREELKLRREQGEVIPTALAQFLYFGFSKKIATDCLRLKKKLGAKVDNLVIEGNAQGILELYDNEISVIIQETKKQQKLDVEKWIEEHPEMDLCSDE